MRPNTDGRRHSRSEDTDGALSVAAVSNWILEAFRSISHRGAWAEASPAERARTAKTATSAVLALFGSSGWIRSVRCQRVIRQVSFQGGSGSRGLEGPR